MVGLVGERVDGSPGHPAVPQRRGQCGFVHDPAAAGVDQERARLHHRQLLGAHEVPRQPGQRHVHGHEVRLPIERPFVHPPDRFIERHRYQVVGEDPGTECREQADDPATDPSHAHHTHRDLGEPPALDPRPHPLSDRGVRQMHTAKQRQRQPDRELRHGVGRSLRRVGNSDPPRARGKQVHVVEPNAHSGNQPELRRRLHHTLGDRPGAGDQDVEAGYQRDQLRFGESAADRVDDVLDTRLVEQHQ